MTLSLLILQITYDCQVITSILAMIINLLILQSRLTEVNLVEEVERPRLQRRQQQSSGRLATRAGIVNTGNGQGSVAALSAQDARLLPRLLKTFACLRLQNGVFL